MQKLLLWPIVLWILLATSIEAKSLNVVTTTPDLAWLASELLKERGEVTALLSGEEDVHAVDAVPSFILASSKADVICMVGMSLEIGWIPKVIEKTANQQIQNGRVGYCDIGATIEGREKPKGPVDRSMGDVHPEGNPHYYLSLPLLKKAATTMAGCFMAQLLHSDINAVEANLKRLHQMMDHQHQALKAKLKNHFGSKLPLVAQYHGNFTYFTESYGIPLFGNIETTPGVAPSAGAIARGALDARQKNVSVVLAVPHNPRSSVEKFASIVKVPTVIHSDVSQPDRESIKNPLLVQQSLVEKIIESLPRKTKPTSP